MSTGYRLADTVCNTTHHYAFAPCCSNQVHLVTAIISNLHQRQRHRYLLFGTSIEIDAAIGVIIHAYHLIVGRIHANFLSTRVTTFFEQVFVDLLAQHTHLTVLTHIHLVDETSIVHLG